MKYISNMYEYWYCVKIWGLGAWRDPMIRKNIIYPLIICLVAHGRERQRGRKDREGLPTLSTMPLTACQRLIFDNQKPNTANELTVIAEEDWKRMKEKGAKGGNQGGRKTRGKSRDIGSRWMCKPGYTSQRESRTAWWRILLNRPSRLSIAAIGRYDMEVNGRVTPILLRRGFPIKTPPTCYKYND